MNCCTNILDIGCFDSCDTITLNEATASVDFIYPTNGTYKFRFESQFRHTFTQVGVAGEIMTLDLSMFPENYQIDLKIFNPDGSRFTVMYSSSEYDCFRMNIDVYNDSNYTPVDNVLDSGCCKPKILSASGQSYVLAQADWITYGDIPNIEVYVKFGTEYVLTPVEPVYDQMPQPETISITLPGAPADDWFIKIS